MLSTSSLALLTDLYQLTMIYGYWKQKLDHAEAVFHLFFRRAPFQGGFTLTAGLQPLIHYIEKLRFQKEDLDYLSTLKNALGAPLFCEAFLKMLEEMQIRIDLDAIPEGNVVFPFEPLIRVKGPLIQAQLLETVLLNQINFASLIATKAARICLAAGNDPVIEFGLRRAQGMDGALTASRSSYIGGCSSTSNLLAGKLLDIPVAGTHAHSWIMAFDNEQAAFKAYAEAFPDNSLFLVDTYDTIQGVREAIRTAKELKATGHHFLGIRLDSGDLTHLSIEARDLLDAAGFSDAQIIASNDLDELLITDLKRQGAKINIWGVGTSLVTGKECSSLDGVYKLSAIRYSSHEPWQDRLKLSERMVKVSNPGIIQVHRFFSKNEAVADLLYDIELGFEQSGVMIDPMDATHRKEILPDWEGRDLLVPIFREGICVYKSPSLKEIQTSAKENLKQFSSSIKRLIHPHVYPVGMEKRFYAKKTRLVTKLRQEILRAKRKG